VNNERLAAINNFVRNTVTAVANAALYSIEHPQVRQLCAAALDDLRIALKETGEMSLLLIDDELVADGELLGTNLYQGKFIQALKMRGIGHLKLIAGVTPGELHGLVADLRRGVKVAEVTSSEHLRYGKVEVRMALDDAGESVLDEFRKLPAFQQISDEELLRLMEIYEGVRKDRKLKVTGINDIVSGFIRTFREQLDPLLAISPLKAIDEYTFTHSTNVCILNLAQAMALGIDGQLLHDIGIAGMLHDMGKLFIPEEVLTKPAPLDEHEWAMMRLHPIRGAMYLLNTPGVPQLAVLTAFEHHMYYDFSGYPQVMGSWTQHLGSQMTAVSDAFDAMRSRRVYQEATEYQEISAVLLDISGTHLHPLLVKNFLGILQKSCKI